MYADDTSADLISSVEWFKIKRIPLNFQKIGSEVMCFFRIAMQSVSYTIGNYKLNQRHCWCGYKYGLNWSNVVYYIS